MRAVCKVSDLTTNPVGANVQQSTGVATSGETLYWTNAYSIGTGTYSECTALRSTRDHRRRLHRLQHRLRRLGRHDVDDGDGYVQHCHGLVGYHQRVQSE